MNSRRIVLFFLIFPVFFGFAQNFELKKPNVAKLNVELRKKHFSQDIIYIYLNRNYKAVSEKLEFDTNDYPNSSKGAFKQKFEHGITYSKGLYNKFLYSNATTLTLPKTDKESVIQWVELITESYFGSSVNDHEWNLDKTEYGAYGISCSFQITETENSTEISMHCGC